MGCASKPLANCTAELIKASSEFSSPIKGVEGTQVFFSFRVGNCSPYKIKEVLDAHFEQWRIEKGYESYKVLEYSPGKLMWNQRYIVVYN